MMAVVAPDPGPDVSRWIPTLWPTTILVGLLALGCSQTVKVTDQPAAPATPNNAVVLDDALETHYLDDPLCSRDGLPDLKRSWAPDAAAIERLEQDLPSLEGAQSSTDGSPPVKLPNPRAYYRQYVGVILDDGRKLVYVNAFADGRLLKLEQGSWKHSLLVPCGGGPSNWGVLYDPFQRRFERLEINGPQ